MAEGKQVLEPELGPGPGHPHPQCAPGTARSPSATGRRCSRRGRRAAPARTAGPARRHRVPRSPGRAARRRAVRVPWRRGPRHAARMPHGGLRVRGRQVARDHDGIGQHRLGRQPLACHQQPLQAVLHQVVDVSGVRGPGGDNAPDHRFHRGDLMRRGCRLRFPIEPPLFSLSVVAWWRGQPGLARNRAYPASGRLGHLRTIPGLPRNGGPVGAFSQ